MAVDESNDGEAARAVRAGLRSNDPPDVGVRDWAEFTLALQDDAGRVVGGLVATSMWRWLSIDALWVDESQRRAGLGSRLVAAAEARALAAGCDHASLSTFDFQAREFYEKQGYVVYGQLDGFPAGHTHFHMRKALR